MKNKSQRVNQHNGCHAGSYHRNSTPESVYKIPSKQPHRFFKAEPINAQRNDNLNMNIEELIMAMRLMRQM